MGADGHATGTGAAGIVLWYVGAGRSRVVSLADLMEPAGEGVQALGS